LQGATKELAVTVAASLTTLPPAKAAEALINEGTADADWLDAFADALEQRRSAKAFARVLRVWGLSQAEAGRRLGVSRQAIGKWLTGGVPVDREPTVADLAAATDVLVHHLQRDRIPAVVQRPIPARDGASLLDLISEGRHRDVLKTCRAMFDFRQVHV
jgi:hypothetical protein